MDLAKQVSEFFIKKIKEKNWTGVEEFYVGEEHSDFTTVRIFSNKEIIRIIFKKQLTGAYFVYTNNKFESCSDIHLFENELYYLDKFGDLILEKILKRTTVIVIKTEEEKNNQIDRLLDKYNLYQKLFNQTKEEKYLRKAERLMNFLKNKKN